MISAWLIKAWDLQVVQAGTIRLGGGLYSHWGAARWGLGCSRSWPRACADWCGQGRAADAWQPAGASRRCLLPRVPEQKSKITFPYKDVLHTKRERLSAWVLIDFRLTFRLRSTFDWFFFLICFIDYDLRYVSLAKLYKFHGYNLHLPCVRVCVCVCVVACACEWASEKRKKWEGERCCWWQTMLCIVSNNYRLLWMSDADGWAIQYICVCMREYSH